MVSTLNFMKQLIVYVLLDICFLTPEYTGFTVCRYSFVQAVLNINVKTFKIAMGVQVLCNKNMNTRMNSNRMRTVRSSSRLLWGGGGSAWGWGVSAWGWGRVSAGGGGVSHHALGQTPCEQND